MAVKTLHVYVLIPAEGADESSIEHYAWQALFNLAAKESIFGATSELRRSGPDFYQMSLPTGQVIRGTFRQYEVDFEVEDARTVGG